MRRCLHKEKVFDNRFEQKKFSKVVQNQKSVSKFVEASRLNLYDFQTNIMKLTLKYGVGKRPDKGTMVDYQIELELSGYVILDVFNEDLMSRGGEPVAFDHDCLKNLRNLLFHQW
jgi:hypothetical protein